MPTIPLLVWFITVSFIVAWNLSTLCSDYWLKYIRLWRIVTSPSLKKLTDRPASSSCDFSPNFEIER